MVKTKEQYFSQLKELRDFYQEHEKGIIAAAIQNPIQYYISYIMNYHALFTPIERDAWNSIRCKGRVVLYPQYPVGQYYVDFGNPHLKIALELDGKEWHKDKERDQARDEEIEKLGWATFRITGTEMSRTKYPEVIDLVNGDRDEIEYWILETGDGVIEAIKQVYFLKHKYDPDDIDDDWEWFLELCKATLTKHKPWGKMEWQNLQ